MKFLIAESDPDLRRALEQSVGRSGGEAIVADDGEAAWRLLQAGSGSAVVMASESLPGVGGLALCEMLRRDPRSACHYFILVAASVDASTLERATRAGVDDVVVLPDADPALVAFRLRAAQKIVELVRRAEDAESQARATAIRDPVTGTLNRRTVLGLLEREVARAARDGTPLAVLVIAVDQLDRISEHDGEETAEEVLAETSRRTERLLRPYDGLGRYSDDELLVVLPMCDAGRGAGVATRIRNHVATEPVRVRPLAVSVTVSVGVAAAAGEAISHDVLARAARKLAREARAAGGNRVQAPPPGELSSV